MHYATEYCFSMESMHPLYLSYSNIVSPIGFVLKNQTETYFVLVLILLALVTCLCWYIIWLGKIRRENELAQQPQALFLAHSVEKRMPFSLKFETQSLIQKYEQQVDKNRQLMKKLCCKTK